MSKVLFRLYGVPFTSYKSAMLCMFRVSRGYLLTLLYIMPFYLIGYGYSKVRFRWKIWIPFHQKMKWIGKDILKFHKTFCHVCFNKSFMLDKCVFVRHSVYPFGAGLNIMIGLAWLCEKMKVNIKIDHSTGAIWRYFENNTLINTTDQSLGQRFEYSKSNIEQVGEGRYAMYSISSEYGHKVLSKLSIKESLKRSANEWFDKHIKGDWVAVHYRGTDVEMKKNGHFKYRYRIELDSYIIYLKGVLDEQSSIFVCSDQAQFIDKMNEAFPGRVYARAIKRSYDNNSLHTWGSVSNPQQEIDALIDLLILAKAELIYTTGSSFVDVVRYFNPQTKIVSLDRRRMGRGKNNIPIPRKDLLNRLSRPLLPY